MADMQSSAPSPKGRQPGGVAGLDQGHLSKSRLVLFALTAMTPGTGMALVPILVFGYVGETSWASLLVAMLAAVCIGAAVRVFARRYIVSGSLYSYVGEVLGTWGRRVVGASLLLGFIAMLAAVVAQCGLFAGSFLTSIGVHHANGVLGQALIYIVVLTISAYIVIIGLSASLRTSLILSGIAVPPILVITIASAAHTGLRLSSQFDFSGMTWNGVFQGVVGALAFLIGFESCAALAVETKDPKRSVPLALMGVPVILAIMWIIPTVAQVPGLADASRQIASGQSAPAALAVQAGLGESFAKATDLIFAFEAFVAIIGFLSYGSRVFATLATEGLLPRRIADVSARLHTPVKSIVTLSALGLLTMVCTMADVGDITNGFTVVATLLTYAWTPSYLLAAIGAIVLLVRDLRGPGRSARSWIGSFAACVVVVVTVVGIYVNGVINPPPAPYDAAIWIAAVALGAVILVYTVGPVVRSRCGGGFLARHNPAENDPDSRAIAVPE
ncbi:APC family permease [Catenulispora rubra]|uniref:APC family permease n=1 Tax=Catenulispora rubra TaxID=280293 RepID=UPI0018925658|nr:APC family permease [Catenulispora rubra]